MPRTRSRRHLATALGTVAATLLLSACETGSWSSRCDSSGSCRLEISGTEFHDLPRSLNSQGRFRRVREKIRLAEATQGGTATIQVGEGDNVCAQGEDFVQGDITFTCTEVGSTSVVLDTARAQR